MSNTIKLSNGNVIATTDIKMIQPLTDADRTQLSERLQIDGSQFNARITFSNKTTQLARETVDDLKANGLALVNAGHDRFLPASNILVAKPFSKDQATALAEKGYKLSHTFRSTVETTAGIVLSTGQPQQVMDRKVRALGLVNG